MNLAELMTEEQAAEFISKGTGRKVTRNQLRQLRFQRKRNGKYHRLLRVVAPPPSFKFDPNSKRSESVYKLSDLETCVREINAALAEKEAAKEGA